MSKKDKTPNGVETEDINPALTTAEERITAREEKRQRIEDIDLEAIDKIVTAEDLQKGGKIRLERRGPLDQHYSYLTTITAEDWDTGDRLEWVKKMFGGGDYQGRTFRANGQMYKMFNFRIDSRYKGQLDDDAIKALQSEKERGGTTDVINKVLDLVKQPRDGGINLADIMAMMDKTNSKSENSNMLMMTMMMKSMELAQANTAAMMAAMATAFGGRSEGGSGMNELLVKLIEQKQERTPITETLEMMKSIKEIFDKPTTEEEKDDMFSKIGRLAAPLLTNMFGQPQQPSNAQTSDPNQVSAPMPGQPQSSAPQQIAQPAKAEDKGPNLGGFYAQMPLEYKMMFQMMFTAAQKGADPAVYADLIEDQCDEQSLAWFKSILTQSDWCAKLFGDESAVAGIRPWLNDLRELLVEPAPASTNEPAYGTKNNPVEGAKSPGVPVSTEQPAA